MQPPISTSGRATPKVFEHFPYFVVIRPVVKQWNESREGKLAGKADYPHDGVPLNFGSASENVYIGVESPTKNRVKGKSSRGIGENLGVKNGLCFHKVTPRTGKTAPV